MSEIWMRGNGPLEGEVKVQGSKNAALPMMAATVLHEGRTVLHNCPRIADVFEMEAILRSIGVKTAWSGHTLELDCNKICETGIPGEETRTMRSSILLLGSMLGRCKRIRIGYPGGCTIGARPVDLHLDAMKKMGVLIREIEGEICGECPEGLSGAHIHFPISSVGATENVILAAVLAEGVTLLRNAAKEPEIIALCEFLNGAGAKISGIGTDILEIIGVSGLREGYYVVPSDRIVAGTYLFACAGCGGKIELCNVDIEHMHAVCESLSRMGAVLEYDEKNIRMEMKERPKTLPYVQTAVYPGFPTDLQSPLMTVLAVAEGTSVIEEAIFENRFRIVKELQAMGADIQTVGQYAKICGRECLYGRNVVAEELRGGAALVLAGLVAQGVTTVGNRTFIDRGYEDICQDLKNLGAKINVR